MGKGNGSSERKSNTERKTESPEGRGGRPDTLWRAKESVSQILSCSRATAHSRFLSSFHPHPHLFLLLLIGSDWIWPADAKHAQCPAQGARSGDMQHTNPLRDTATKDSNRIGVIMAAITLRCHHYYYYYNGTRLT